MKYHLSLYNLSRLWNKLCFLLRALSMKMVWDITGCNKDGYNKVIMTTLSKRR